MTLGKKGVAGNDPDSFDQPTGIAVAPTGDIFVSDGHGKNDRVVVNGTNSYAIQHHCRKALEQAPLANGAP